MGNTVQAPDKPEPTEPGWYTYSGGREVMIFHLRETHRGTMQWSAHFDDGTADDCVWAYIEQALGVWDLVPLDRERTKKEVLTELANEWQYCGWVILTSVKVGEGIPALAYGQPVNDWLRARANGTQDV